MIYAKKMYGCELLHISKISKKQSDEAIVADDRLSIV
jgi:hypothetical protein